MAAFRFAVTRIIPIALALVTLVAPCRAQEDASARDVARQRFEAGVEAFRAGRYKDAVDLLMAADKAMHSPAFAFNIGVAYEAMGDDASALKWLREYVREAPNADDRKDVDQKISDLEAKLRERGVQQVTVLSVPESATVVLDGRPVGLTPWTAEIYPGKHKVALQLSGYDTAERLFELHPHRSMDVSVELSAHRAAETKPAAPADAPSPAPTESASASPWPWIALGAGAAALGGALVFEISRANAVDEARNASQIDYRSKVETAEDRQTVARVFAGVGAALVVTGGVLLVLDLTREPDAPSVGMGCTEIGCGALARGTF